VNVISYPSIEEIRNFKTPMTDGEWQVYDYFKKGLECLTGRFFELHVQPNINGDRPDFVILEKSNATSGGGVWIIEVKDWNLAYYNVNGSGNEWSLKNNKAKIASPFQQVLKYKNNLFEKHSLELLREKFKNESIYGLVRTAVFLTSSTYRLSKDELSNTHRFTKIFDVNSFGDFSILENFMSIRTSQLNDTLYRSIAQYLLPISAEIEQREVKFDDQQRSIIKTTNKRLKFHGIAGSGKTEVLAKRISMALDEELEVLVLTFNITLRNYLQDRIRNSARKTIKNKNLTISNYHEYFATEANNCEKKLSYDVYDDWAKLSFFEGGSPRRYDAVFIDEVQDYEENWLRIVEKYFLKEDGLFMVCGDVSQNIYKKEMGIDKLPIIPHMNWKWRGLTNSYRSKGNVLEVAQVFEKEYLPEISEEAFVSLSELGIAEGQGVLDFSLDISQVIYYKIEKEQITQGIIAIEKYLIEERISPNDYTYLAYSKAILREIFDIIQENFRKMNEKGINRTFVTNKEFKMIEKRSNEEWALIKKNPKLEFEREISNSYEQLLKKNIKNFERLLKINFRKNSGHTKLSTVHSFKGYDEDVVVLVLTDKKNGLSPEEIYTGITRAKKKLFILDLSTSAFEIFFRRNSTVI